MKTKTSHTPWPWVALEGSSYGIIVDLGGKAIVNGDGVTEENESCEANARLITAAPDFLAAAKGLDLGIFPCDFYITIDSNDPYTCGRGNRMCPQCQAKILLRAAIKKAEGGKS